MGSSNNVFSPWIKWDLEKWEPLYKNLPLLFYPKKSTLYQEGKLYQHLFIIASGRVRITTYSQDGTEKQLYIAETGSICLENPVLAQTPSHSNAMAIVDCQVYKIPLSHVMETLKQHWDVNFELLQFISRKNIMLSQQIVDLSFLQSLQRICRTLLNLCEQYGTTTEQGILINIRFTHQDVANIVNCSRVTVSNIFNYLMDQKIISRPESYFIVTSPEKLKELAIRSEGKFQI